jgi:hypothetical protein
MRCAPASALGAGSTWPGRRRSISARRDGLAPTVLAAFGRLRQGLDRSPPTCSASRRGSVSSSTGSGRRRLGPRAGCLLLSSVPSTANASTFAALVILDQERPGERHLRRHRRPRARSTAVRHRRSSTSSTRSVRPSMPRPGCATRSLVASD